MEAVTDEPEPYPLPPYTDAEKMRDLMQIIQVQREQIERLKRALREAGVKGF
jgi:hypothetical protein